MWGGEINRWNSDSNDSSDTEDLQNETPLKGVDPEFRNTLIKIKQQLYDQIVYSPDEQSNNAQDLGLLQDYLTHLNCIYLLTIHARNGLTQYSSIETLPVSLQASIRDLLQWIHEYFHNNVKEDTLPYSRTIDQVLHEDPFVQE
jgi:hypothetical protein